jgi:hypothetical protein
VKWRSTVVILTVRVCSRRQQIDYVHRAVLRCCIVQGSSAIFVDARSWLAFGLLGYQEGLLEA